MQRKTEKREIDSLIFYINQFPARKAIKLEKKTITYLAPMLSILEGMNLDSDIDFSKIVKGVQEVLTNLNEDALEQYIFEMIENTSVSIFNEKKQEQILKLNSENGQIFDLIFTGKTITVYKLLLEIMKVNKFAFFELLGGGGQKIGIFG